MVSSSGTPVRADRLRSLNRPQPVQVLCADTPVAHGLADRVPAAVTENGRWRRVESIGEIWQIDDEWWRNVISRRYYDVVLQGGAHVALYEDLTTGAWFIQQP